MAHDRLVVEAAKQPTKQKETGHRASMLCVKQSGDKRHIGSGVSLFDDDLCAQRRRPIQHHNVNGFVKNVLQNAAASVRSLLFLCFEKNIMPNRLPHRGVHASLVSTVIVVSPKWKPSIIAAGAEMT